MTKTTRRIFLVKAAAAFSAVVSWPKFIKPTAASAQDARTHKIEITNFKYVPDYLEVKPGDTIIWTNRDIAPHTATAIDKSWDTGTIKKNKSATLLVSDQMSGKYFCRFHPKMKAEFKITA